MARLEQALVGAGVEPGDPPFQLLDPQQPLLEVGQVEVSDLQLAPGRGFEGGGQLDHPAVVDVESGDGIVRLGVGRFLLDADGAARGVEFHHPVALGVDHRVTEDQCAFGKFGEDPLQAHAPVEDVVAENQADVVAGDEIGADLERLGDSLRFGLHGVLDRNAPLTPVTQQALETGDVLRGGNQQDVPHPGPHQGRDRIVDHRLVVDRHQLLAGHQGQRVEPGAGPAGENDTLFHSGHVR